MRGEAQDKHASPILRGRRVLTRVALAFIFSAVVAFAGSAAQACPGGEHGVHHAAGKRAIILVLHKAATVAIVTAVPGHAKTDYLCGGSRCHCSSGCCSAGNSAMDVTNATFAVSDKSLEITVVDLGEASSLKPPPNFRPPQIA